MGASSVTGKGIGDAGKVTGKDLAELVNGPSILEAGVVTTSGATPSSPPVYSLGSVVFPNPMSEKANNYVVILTSQNGGKCYVTSMNETSGKFSGFTCSSEVDCDVMYIVTKKGHRPKI